MTDVEAIVRKLTKARKRAVIGCVPGFLDDDSLRGGERKMLYSLKEQGLMEHRNERHHPVLSIFLTPLGLAIRTYLLKDKTR